ncbi:MAG: hypothetical protein JWL91_2307 [Sphingomonas bacterium]|jgi:hypothetical protein|nr:hypothetical protein [Sphingomonas bacterium]MDB5690431.1 hypothetical protein [Sphingomonas bacterium]
MADDASEFLAAWSLAREDKSPLSRGEAEAVAADWEADASGNGIGRAELDAAAGGDLPAYLLRVFGEASDQDFPTPAS